MSRGRKSKVTEEKYLNAVRRTRTLDDKVIGEYIGVDRSNIYRFKKNNPLVLEKAKGIIASFQITKFNAENLTIDLFRRIPVIREWVSLQVDRPVGKLTIQQRVQAFFNLCKHLNTHPEQLTLDQLSTFVKEAKRAHNKDEPFIEGLYYLNIRKPIRSFFQLTKGISGELLTSRGIDAGRSKGTGSQAKQKVSKEQRARVIEALPDAIKYTLETGLQRYEVYEYEPVHMEMKAITYFMYYTATRIGSTDPNNRGSLSVRTNNDKHVLTNDEWNLNLWDKGKGRGIEWDKMLIDDGLDKIRNYTCERFEIQHKNIEYELKEIDSYLFPILNKDYQLERKIMKLALNRAGVTTRIPNHIWRHTFAQDCLNATDWNYELVASLGGWKDTNTLKLSYGEMDEEARRRGLRKAMGLPIEDVTYELRF